MRQTTTLRETKPKGVLEQSLLICEVKYYSVYEQDIALKTADKMQTSLENWGRSRIPLKSFL